MADITGADLEKTLKERAARLGMTVDQLLIHDRTSLRKFVQSHAECLSPGLIEREDLLPLLANVINCPMCAAMVSAAHKAKYPPVDGIDGEEQDIRASRDMPRQR